MRTAPVEPTTNDVALLFAARDGDAALVSELLAAGADVNAVTNHVNTPLIMAAQHGSPETIVKLLAWHPIVDAAKMRGGQAVPYSSLFTITFRRVAAIEELLMRCSEPVSPRRALD